MVDKKLLEILVCPRCHGSLEYHPQAPERLICRTCKLAYRVDDDIPVMLIDEAEKI